MTTAGKTHAGWLLLLTMLCGASYGAELLKDINEQPAIRKAGVMMLGRIGSDVIFSAGYFFESNTELGLWRSDGTAAGTQRILASETPPAFFEPEPLVSTGSQVFWIGKNPFDEAEHSRGYALWATDGTSAGTAKLANLPDWSGSDSVIGLLPGNVVVFRTSSELWRTDGTAAGTWSVARFASVVAAASVVGDRIYFAASGPEGEELWVTDGSNVPANTHLVADLEPGPESSFPSHFTKVGNDLYFTAFTGGIGRVWRRDALGNLDPITPATFTASIECTAGGLVYFTAAGQPAGALWRTDGTGAGTLMLLPATSGQVNWMGECKNVGDRVFFPVLDGDTFRLWQSDGTVASTVATSFSQGTSSMSLVHWSGTHWFVSTADETSAFYRQLWATDGASDTRLVVNGVPDHVVEYQAAGLGSHVVFTARIMTPQDSSPQPLPNLQLWRADADGRNPLRLEDKVHNEPPYRADISADSARFRLVNQLLFYRSRDELSVTDGTLAGTRVVRQLVPNGTGPSFSRPFVRAGAISLFVADDGLTGTELWRTDGTAGGTLQVMDIKPGSSGASPANLQVIDNLTYFDADDGAHGRELWVSDGTASGTRMIADNLPGPGGSTFNNCIEMLKFNGFVYFSSRNGAGGELWRTDNTPGGTTLVWDARDNSCPRPLAVVGSTLYFAGDGQLWRTDGSGASPQQVAGLASPIPFPDTPAQFRGELVVSTSSNLTILTRRTSLWSIGGGSPRLLIDFGDTANGIAQTQISWVIATDSALYFAVNDSGRGTHAGIYRWTGGNASPERFVSDLTVISNGLVDHFGARIAFIGWSAATGQEIFISDGTTAGTKAITDVSGPGELHLGGMLVAGPALYFTFVDALLAPSQVGRNNGTLETFERLTDLVSDRVGAVGVVDGELIYEIDDVRETVGREPYIIRNQKPRAAADSATVAAGQSVTIALAPNDSDDDGQVIPWGARVVSPPTHGTVMINSEGVATYQANANFGGTDTFSYVAADNGGRESAPAIVTVTVQGGAGPGAPSEPPRRGGGGSSGWLLLLALAAFVARLRNQAADSGVYAYKRLCVRSMSASVSAGFSARSRMIRAMNASAGTAGLQ